MPAVKITIEDGGLLVDGDITLSDDRGRELDFDGTLAN
jgi:hypothetical protein